MLFDGYPRTQSQAEKLDSMLATKKQMIGKVIEIKVKDNILVERVEGRRIHLESGRSYHTKFNPPKVKDKDDFTGEPLIQRKDDNAEALKTRLGAYHSQTSPVLDYYGKKNILATINGEQGMDKVWTQIHDSVYAKMF